MQSRYRRAAALSLPYARHGGVPLGRHRLLRLINAALSRLLATRLLAAGLDGGCRTNQSESRSVNRSRDNTPHAAADARIAGTMMAKSIQPVSSSHRCMYNHFSRI